MYHKLRKRGTSHCGHGRSSTPRFASATAADGLRLRRSLRLHPCHQLLGLGQDAADDGLNAPGGRVKAVGLVEGTVGGDPVEEERVEYDVVRRRERREDCIEGTDVIGP